MEGIWMSGTNKTSYLVYNTKIEAYLGYRKLDEYTTIGGGWFEVEAKLFFDKDWGAQIVDIPVTASTSSLHREFLAEIANLVFVNQNYDEDFSHIVCVPVDITKVNNTFRIRDLEPDFFNAIPFEEVVGIGEAIALKVDIDHTIRYDALP